MQKQIKDWKVAAEASLEVREFSISKIEKLKTLSSEPPAPAPTAAAEITVQKSFRMNEYSKRALSLDVTERKELDEKVKEALSQIQHKVEKDAEARGYQDGLERGRKEALQKREGELSEKLSRLEALLHSFENAGKRIFEENEKVLIDVIRKVSSKLALKEIELDPEYLKRLVLHILEEVPLKDRVQILIHTKDQSGMDDLHALLERKFPELKNISIAVSDTIQLGGCKVETKWNVVDATLETQVLESLRVLSEIKGNAAE